MTQLVRLKPFIPAVLSFVLLACFSSTDKNNPVEVPGDSKLTSDAPEEVLLETGKQLYSNGLYSVAKDSFETLQAVFPVGPYSEFAQIKVADCSFLAREYETAAAAYESFIQEHPGHAALDYVTFQAGLSHYLTNKGVGRDIAPLEQALNLFQQTIEKFPNSSYAQSAEKYVQLTQNRVAQHKQEVLAFYKRQGFRKAYKNRLNEFKSSYAKFTDIEQPATETQKQSILVKNKPLTSPSLVALNYYTDDQGRAALKLLPFKSIEVPSTLSHKSGTIRLERVKCKSGSQPSVSLYFDGSENTGIFLSELANHHPILKSKASLALLDLPELDGEIRSYNCFSSADLTVESQGEISLKSEQDLEVLFLEFPNRLLLLPKTK